MKSPQKPSHRQGFTLVELLTVIAVIGILAAILIPTIGAVQETAQQTQSASNLKQIATSYQTYSTSGSRARNIPSAAAPDIQNWAAVLAANVDLNDPILYFIGFSDDVAADVVQYTTIVDAAGAIDGNFAAAPVSYSAVAGLSLTSPATQTPLIWTKGLEAGGFWTAAASPWGSNTGHIAYLDSHVTKFSGNNEEVIVNLVSHPRSASPSTATTNVSDAVNAGATTVIVEGPAIN